ncbi:MAG: Cys-tRNA(Pro) deacylase [Methanomethylophilus sp.]|jgi:Cys-tRNA(Pro)/Cys-tRNA(Cys) deacylase
MDKTNPMRILERAGIEYEVNDYTATGAVSGMDVAAALGEDPRTAFKTLVTQGKSDRFYVFVLPVCCELDLKKAAAAVGEKSVAMIKSKDLLPTTGYVHGGCSPLGMRKQLRTVIDASAENLDKIYISGGKVGIQIGLKFSDLKKVLDFRTADIVRPAPGPSQ